MMKESNVFLNITSGLLKGKEVKYAEKPLKDLKGIFQDEAARSAMDQDMLIYTVQSFMPVAEGTAGGLFFGSTTIYPGTVGNEYFMTRGHFHRNPSSAEFYWCIQGEGRLIMMDGERETRAEIMTPGSLHYIPGNVAHRVANTGKGNLVFNACWPSDAGHDYETINTGGFSARLMKLNGKPELKIL